MKIVFTLWNIALSCWLIVAFQHLGMLEKPAPKLRGGDPIIIRHNVDWYAKPTPTPKPKLKGLVA